jgi:Tat protein translocase TatB subunit
MFGIGMQEVLLILVIALVVIGPKKLPEVAKALGKGYGEFRRAFEDMKSSINVDMKTEEEKERLREIHERVQPPEETPAPEPLVKPATPPVRVAGEEAPASPVAEDASPNEKRLKEEAGNTPPKPPESSYEDEEIEGDGG